MKQLFYTRVTAKAPALAATDGKLNCLCLAYHVADAWTAMTMR